MGSRTKETYDFCKQNMVECKKEMQFAKENAHKLKTVQTEMHSAINKFLGDDILQQANTEFQVSSSDKGRTKTTYEYKINNDNVSYHELATFFKRKIISQLIKHIGGLAAQGSSLHKAHKNVQRDMDVFEDEIKDESDAVTKLINASAHMLSSVELFKNDEKLQRDLIALQAPTSETVSVDDGDGNEDPENHLAQVCAEQQELNKGKVGEKNKQQGHDDKEKK